MIHLLNNWCVGDGDMMCLLSVWRVGDAIADVDADVDLIVVDATLDSTDATADAAVAAANFVDVAAAAAVGMAKAA